MARVCPMNQHELNLVEQGEAEIAERMRDVRSRFRSGDHVELVDDARSPPIQRRASEPTLEGGLPIEFEAGVTYIVHGLAGIWLLFKRDDNRSLWGVTPVPPEQARRRPLQLALARHFKVVAEDAVTPAKISALATVFEHLQCDQVRGLKRKLAAMTLELGRANLEKDRMQSRFRSVAEGLLSGGRAAVAASTRSRGAPRLALVAAGESMSDAAGVLNAAYVDSASSSSLL